MVQRQGDGAVREVHERAHLDLLCVVVENVEQSQELLRSSSSRGISWRHLGNFRHHGLLDVKGMVRQSYEGRSQYPHVLELRDRGPRKARSASSTVWTHSDLQEDARNGDPISPPREQ